MVAAASCGAPKKCNPQSCSTGCCTPNDECLSGGENSACGTSGNACVDCALNAQVCGQKVCVASNTGGGNGGMDAGVDAGTFTACTRTPLDCADQTIQGLGLFSNIATGGVVNVVDGAGFKSTVDSTGGGFTPSESYVYLRFATTGLQKLPIDDMAALDSMDWDIAFRRYVIRINSGDSGPSCVAAEGRTESYDSITSVPSNYLPGGDDFISRPAACMFVPDGSGLGSSPNTALASYYQYQGCVQMTNKAWVITTQTGHHVKLVVLTYYSTEAGQTSCNTSGSSGGALGGTMRLRWQYLD
jgi:HmuY protein